MYWAFENQIADGNLMIKKFNCLKYVVSPIVCFPNNNNNNNEIRLISAGMQCDTNVSCY